MAYTNPNPDIEREIKNLQNIINDKTLSRRERRGKISAQKQILRNMGVLSLPFSVNEKKLGEKK